MLRRLIVHHFIDGFLKDSQDSDITLIRHGWELHIVWWLLPIIGMITSPGLSSTPLISSTTYYHKLL